MKLKYVLILLVLLMPLNVLASEGVVTASSVLYVREKPTTESNRVLCDDGTDVELGAGSKVTIISEHDSLGGNDSCGSKKWYKVKGNDWSDGKEYEGYACSSFIRKLEPTVPVDDTKTIPELYDVTSYGTYLNTIGEYERVPIVVPKDTEDKTCTKTLIVIDNVVTCVDASALSKIVEVKVLDTAEIEYNYEAELAKFPKSYQDKIKLIHEKHPTWRFYAYDTNLDWNEAVIKEKRNSLIQMQNGTYIKSTMYDTEELVNYDWKTDTFKPHESGVWVTPSKAATAYFLDPRNYLDLYYDDEEPVIDYKDIFVFEDARAYTYQKDEITNKMLYYAKATGGFETPNGYKTYYESFTVASAFSKISPLILISRSRNETGNFKSGSVTGTFVNDYGLDLSGYYNYFNVGAYGALPITNGLLYAKAAGWTDPYKSITEGSTFIGTKYIYNGQETQYFQKFNVSPYTNTTVYGHQYQTNIQAPVTEAGMVFWGYYDSGNIEESIVFHIPVYKNMPEEQVMKPISGNPNNWLKEIKIDDKAILNTNDSFDGNLYYSYNNNWDEKEDETFKNNVILYTVEWNTNEVNIKATPVVSTTTVQNIGKVKLTNKETTVDLISTAQNKTTKTYRIIITKKDKPATDDNGDIVYPDIKEVLSKTSVKYDSQYIKGLPKGTTYENFINTVTKIDNGVKVTVEKNPNNNTGNFATGDKVIFDNGETKLTLTYILYGDMNGDNTIDLVDLIHVRNIILEQSNLSGAYKKAGDTNKDGKIDLVDLISVRNDILGDAITQ